MSSNKRTVFCRLPGIAVFLFVAAAAAQDGPGRINQRDQELLQKLGLAQQYLTEARFEEAANLLGELLPALKKEAPPGVYDTFAVLKEYADTLVLYQKGKIADAISSAERALSASRALPQEMRSAVLAPSLQILASYYLGQQRFEEAEKLLVEELALLGKTGAPQPLNAPGVAILEAITRAHVLYQKGDVRESTSVAEKALGDARILPVSADNAQALSYGLVGLADLYAAQGRYLEADKLYTEALPLFGKLLQGTHPVKAGVEIAAAVVRAQALYQKGKVAEAVSLAEESLRASRGPAGEDNPAVAGGLHNLALLYLAQGRYGEAEKLLTEERIVLRKLFPEEHPLIANCLGTLGVVYDAQGRYEEAESVYAEVLAIWKKRQVEAHPDLATLLANLGHLRYSEGQYDEAGRRDLEALAMWKKLQVTEHAARALCLNNLAEVYIAEAKYQEAERQYADVLPMLDKLGMNEHPYKATALGNLGLVYYFQGRQKLAETHYRDALAMWETLQIEDHPALAHCLNNLALLYQEQRKYGEAEQLYLRAVAMWKKLLPETPELAFSISNLAQLYVSQGQHAKAEPLCLEALAILRKRLPTDHPNLAIVLNNLAFLYFAQRRLDEAAPLYREALRIWKARLPHEHPIIAGGLSNLALLLWAKQPSSQGSLEEATQLLRESAEIRTSVLGRELNRGGRIEDVGDNLVRIATFEGSSADIALSFAVRPQGLANAETFKTALLEELVQKGRAQEEARRKGQSAPLLSVDAIWRRLPKRGALLQFATYRDLKPEMTDQQVRGSERRYAACILRWDSANPICQDLGSAADVESDATLFRKLSERQGLEVSFDGLPQRMESVMAHLNDVEQLFVAEDGDLNRVPLQAMKTQREGPATWIDRFEITYINSGRDLIWRATEQAATGRAVVAGLNGYGLLASNSRSMGSIDSKALCPDQISAFQTLSQAEPMAQLAARRLDVEPLIGPAATAENLRKAVNGGPSAPRAIVLAFHGCVRKGNDTQEPELRLVVSNGKEGWDFLGAAEVATWHLEGSALYILACWAGSPVGELVGDLRQASTLAGVRYMVAPLWEVEETAASDFLILLLDEQRKSQSPAAALRAAQRRMREMKGYDHPHYWAGYTVNGVGASETR